MSTSALPYRNEVAAILQRLQWRLVDVQVESADARNFLNPVAQFQSEAGDGASTSQLRVKNAVIGAYCPLLHAACGQAGTAQQRQAFTELHRWCYQRIRQRVYDDQDAQDVTQEVLIAVYQNLWKVTEPRGFLAWVGIIVRNQLFSYYDRTHRYIEHNQPFPGDVADDEALDERFIVPSVAERMLLRELSGEEARLVSMLEECMPKKAQLQKQVFVAIVFDELSAGQVAEAMGITANYVYLLFHRAKKTIIKCCPKIMKELSESVPPSARIPYGDSPC